MSQNMVGIDVMPEGITSRNGKMFDKNNWAGKDVPRLFKILHLGTGGCWRWYCCSD